jgi:hypothetical protein
MPSGGQRMYHGDQRSCSFWQTEDGSGAAHVPQYEGDAVAERSHQTGEEVNWLRKAILFGHLKQSVSPLSAAVENCSHTKLVSCGYKLGRRTCVRKRRQLSPAGYLLRFPPVNYNSEEFRFVP